MFSINATRYRPGTLVFKMGCFVAEFLLTSASRGPSAISELLDWMYSVVLGDFCVFDL